MRSGRGGITACASALAVVGLACGAGAALGSKSAHRAADSRSLAAVASAAGNAETVSFDDARRAPGRGMRGPGEQAPRAPLPGRAETVTLCPGAPAPVAVPRGGAPTP